MPDTIFQEMLRGDARGRWVRLRTLTTLRWLAVIGQGAALLGAYLLFDVDAPLELCGLAIAASVAFNLVSMQVNPANARLSERAATLSMLFDLTQVCALLALTGGLANPFALLILAPVTISASALTLRPTAIVGATATSYVSLMAFFSLPLTYKNGEILTPPPIYVFGVWIALIISILFMTFYARRVSAETFRMSRALRAAETALAREQRLTAIGGLAAAAAHELGTPLATIKLVAAEMVDELSDDKDLREDAELIRDQADRCRDILSDLRDGGRSDEHIKHIPVSSLIEEAAEPHNDRGKRVIIRVDGLPLSEAGDRQPIVHRRPEIVHGLRNLIQNAVDFAETSIWIDVSVGKATLRVTVGDDGQGFPEDLQQRLGDPYVTSRPRQATNGASGEYRGLGLGLFIAKTLLERTGARVSFANADRAVRKSNRGLALEARRPSGAVIAAVWPNEAVVSPQNESRSALSENKRFSLQNI